ncbi:hypothetical protein [Arthrobacter sp. NPDC089319]|uniref:hypothetical protein n=1 Tax=Arthrobacter sp. NPDC089319 TaxID=3155915 RepID=UPI00342DD764
MEVERKHCPSTQDDGCSERGSHEFTEDLELLRIEDQIKHIADEADDEEALKIGKTWGVSSVRMGTDCHPGQPLTAPNRAALTITATA